MREARALPVFLERSGRMPNVPQSMSNRSRVAWLAIPALLSLLLATPPSAQQTPTPTPPAPVAPAPTPTPTPTPTPPAPVTPTPTPPALTPAPATPPAVTPAPPVPDAEAGPERGSL